MKLFSKRILKRKKKPETPILKRSLRSWGLASRLEHRHIKGKNRKRPGKEK